MNTTSPLPTPPRRPGSAARMPDTSHARQRAAAAVTLFVARRLGVRVTTTWDGDQLVVACHSGTVGEQIAHELAYAGVPTSFANPTRPRLLAWWETVAETLAP